MLTLYDQNITFYWWPGYIWSTWISLVSDNLNHNQFLDRQISIVMGDKILSWKHLLQPSKCLSCSRSSKPLDACGVTKLIPALDRMKNHGAWLNIAVVAECTIPWINWYGSMEAAWNSFYALYVYIKLILAFTLIIPHEINSNNGAIFVGLLITSIFN